MQNHYGPLIFKILRWLLIALLPGMDSEVALLTRSRQLFVYAVVSCHASFRNLRTMISQSFRFPRAIATRRRDMCCRLSVPSTSLLTRAWVPVQSAMGLELSFHVVTSYWSPMLRYPSRKGPL